MAVSRRLLARLLSPYPAAQAGDLTSGGKFSVEDAKTPTLYWLPLTTCPQVTDLLSRGRWLHRLHIDHADPWHRLLFQSPGASG